MDSWFIEQAKSCECVGDISASSTEDSHASPAANRKNGEKISDFLMIHFTYQLTNGEERPLFCMWWSSGEVENLYKQGITRSI
jgi:hypothetical protein